MNMLQRVTVLLAMACSLVFGHAPCCIVPGACSEISVTHVAGTSCCPRCAERRRAVPAAPERSIEMCDCPTVAGLFQTVEPIEFTPAALPERLVELVQAPCADAPVDAPRAAHAPPRAGRNLPLLL